MEWKYVKTLQSDNLINEFEKEAGFKFDNLYKEYIVKYNGGRPSLKVFDTDKMKERSIKSLLSFNKTDIETIWSTYEWKKNEFGDLYIAFAGDSFGNLICFEKKNGNVVFWNHENDSFEFISKNFISFINALRNI